MLDFLARMASRLSRAFGKTAVATPRSPERTKHLYCGLATQYYIAARFAAMAGLVPVCGNLFHHAVEMYLKAGFVRTVTSDRMRRTFRHDLKRIWRDFKRKNSTCDLSRYDSTVSALSRFESIRYPDRIEKLGMITGVAWTQAHQVKATGLRSGAPKYAVNVPDIDDLVIEVLRGASVNPKAYAGVGEIGRNALLYENLHSAEWT